MRREVQITDDLAVTLGRSDGLVGITISGDEYPIWVYLTADETGFLTTVLNNAYTEARNLEECRP